MLPKESVGNVAAAGGVDPKRLDDWRYLYLVEVGTIVEKNWPLFLADLAVLAGDEEGSKKAWKKEADRLNTLRNEVIASA